MPDKKRLLPAIDAYRRPARLRRDRAPLGQERARTWIASRTCLLARLPEGEKLYPDDFLTDLPERFFVAEMIREQILHKTREEIPYTTGVMIDSFKEDGPWCASRPPSWWSGRTRRAS